MDRFEPNLRIPGPTGLPPSVREGQHLASTLDPSPPGRCVQSRPERWHRDVAAANCAVRDGQRVMRGEVPCAVDESAGR